MKNNLPVQGRSYHQFWRTAGIGGGRLIGALVLGLLGLIVATLIPGLVAGIFDPGIRDDLLAEEVNPTNFLIGNIALALMIPVVMAISALFIKQPAGFITSVTGRMRWGWLLRCFLILMPIWVVQFLVELVVGGEARNLGVNQNTGVLIVIILTTQVFQSAGEEYICRGMLNRVAGSFFENEWAAFLVGGIVSAVTFTALHAAGDPLLNLEYFTFAICAAWLTWRSGGLEAAIAMHCVNNLVSGAVLPFTDLNQAFVRETGVGDVWMLVKAVMVIGSTALLTWLGKRNNLVTRATPGAASAESSANQEQQNLSAGDLTHPSTAETGDADIS